MIEINTRPTDVIANTFRRAMRRFLAEREIVF
jgi:hypothetical protein